MAAGEALCHPFSARRTTGGGTAAVFGHISQTPSGGRAAPYSNKLYAEPTKRSRTPDYNLRRGATKTCGVRKSSEDEI